MQNIVSFEDWLKIHDPVLYEQLENKAKRRILGGLGLGLAGAGLWGMSGGTNNLPPPKEPIPHVRSFNATDEMPPPVDKMPPPAPSIDKMPPPAPSKWDARERVKLLQALQNAGITVRGGLKTSDLPHGTSIDMHGDSSPDNPQENYFNTRNYTYYGKYGKALWTWDGHNIHLVK